MSDIQALTDEEIEVMKLFDDLRMLKASKEEFINGQEASTVEFKGKNFDTENLLDAMMIVDIRRFQELVDMDKPPYADFIRDLEEMPGMASNLRSYDEMRAALVAAFLLLGLFFYRD